jgi:DNA invertase Pin-like site-specific DNA recombinase
MIAPVPDGCLIGYARVSTDDQNLSLQIDSLTGLGIEREDIFTEKISGAKTGLPQLDACLAKLQPGDTLVVSETRSTRSINASLVELIEDLRDRGVGCRSVSDGLIDTPAHQASRKRKCGPREGCTMITR